MVQELRCPSGTRCGSCIHKPRAKGDGSINLQVRAIIGPRSSASAFLARCLYTIVPRHLPLHVACVAHGLVHRLLRIYHLSAPAPCGPSDRLGLSADKCLSSFGCNLQYSKHTPPSSSCSTSCHTRCTSYTGPHLSFHISLAPSLTERRLVALGPPWSKQQSGLFSRPSLEVWSWPWSLFWHSSAGDDQRSKCEVSLFALQRPWMMPNSSRGAVPANIPNDHKSMASGPHHRHP